MCAECCLCDITYLLTHVYFALTAVNSTSLPLPVVTRDWTYVRFFVASPIHTNLDSIGQRKTSQQNMLRFPNIHSSNLEHSEWCRCHGKSLRCCSSRDSLRSQLAGASFRLVFMLSCENWRGNCVADHFTTAVDFTTSRFGDTATCFWWAGTTSALTDFW